MINKINLLKSVGPFDNVSPHPDTTFKKLTLIYGENGKGKTTLANIFRSLASGDHLLIEERRRLGAVEPPHIIIEEENGTLIYQDGQWQPHLLNIAVFDDNFVVQNICSGMEVSSDHRKNLHGLIIGEEGVGLNSAHQTALAKINKHNIAIREKKAKVQSLINGNMDVDIFCELPPHQDIENAISEAEKNINTAQSSGAIKGKNEFQTITTLTVHTTHTITT
ncbi:MAG: AAA family ATPase, partial [Proteobacteria bacterium]|nr:AAA family ATPase [Pseudomonadota bacterium]